MGRARELSKLIADPSSLKVPNTPTASRPPSPDNGTFIFNETTGEFEGYTPEGWGAIGGGGGATGGGNDDIFYENGKVVTTNYTITAGKNAMSAGPITINDGVTVTVPDGSTWTIL